MGLTIVVMYIKRNREKYMIKIISASVCVYNDESMTITTVSIPKIYIR